MEKKIYYLSTCDTCKRIIKDLDLKEDFEFQDIKNEMITGEQLDQFYEYTGSYESLLNKRARKLKSVLETDPVLEDHDYRNLILKDYTFLKRPVLLVGKQLFVGNSKKVITEAKNCLNQVRSEND